MSVCITSNKPLVPTRNGEAPLLAAQRRRWAARHGCVNAESERYLKGRRSHLGRLVGGCLWLHGCLQRRFVASFNGRVQAQRRIRSSHQSGGYDRRAASFSAGVRDSWRFVVAAECGVGANGRFPDA
jgi:hypothetical protein